jgi:hypothetical protein
VVQRALFLLLLARIGPSTLGGRAVADGPQPYIIALPIVRMPDICQPIPDVSYLAIPIDSPPTDPPAAQHPDLNLALRGYRLTPGNPVKGFVSYGGDADNAPRLSDLFSDHRAPEFANVYQVNDWDGRYPGSFWPLTEPEVTLTGLASEPGETLHTPGMFTPHEIYGGGYQAMVLYAAEQRLTLKYTREDNVVLGYTIHLEGICVEPSLLALYKQSDVSGRSHLPGLKASQALGRARGDEVKVVIRDVGSFMDTRSHKDWWRDIPWTGGITALDALGQDWFEQRQRAMQERVGAVGESE